MKIVWRRLVEVVRRVSQMEDSPIVRDRERPMKIVGQAILREI